MNQPQSANIDQLLRDLLFNASTPNRQYAEAQKQRQLNAAKALGELSTSNENVVVGLLVAKARGSEVGIAAANALNANVHQSLLLKRPDLITAASTIIKSGQIKENKQVRVYGIYILFMGVMAFWASQTGQELVIARVIHLSNPFWGILLTMIGLGMIIGATNAIRSSQKHSNSTEKPKVANTSERIETGYGMEVLICPNCKTVNSLSVVNCRICQKDLGKEIPVRNPYL